MRFGPFISSKSVAPTDQINARTDFTDYFAQSGKPAHLWAVGAEIELFGFVREGLERIDPGHVQAIINGFAPETISLVKEDGYVTEAMLGGGGRLTLEPGGQIEFSGAPARSLAEIERALSDYTKRLTEIGKQNQVIFVAAGFDPLRRIEEQKWIPKRRYEIMRPYLETRGPRAWDMMCRTAAIQVNLDYSDIDDLAKKFALATRLAPVAAAIFANSPFEDGELSGYKSTRYRVWLDTDPDRTGPSPIALDDNFTIERFVDYVSKVPMFFVRRADEYIDIAGHSFDEYLAGCGCPMMPIFRDFTDHLTTIFTEARLKPHIEQRSMDCGSIEMTMAALAFWKGLMYDPDTLDRALAIAPKMNRGQYAELQLEVARHGLEAGINATPVIKLADATIELARAGLESVAPDESHYLDVLDQLVTRERASAADILIRNFKGSWHGQIRKAIDHMRIG
ncbi:MAG: glutamate-cysteine ligase family protein [Blastocatellia bacterium]